MQITVEPNKMTDEQRNAVANFILNYPKHADVVHRERMEIEIGCDTTKAQAGIAALQNVVDPAAAFGKGVMQAPEVKAAQVAFNQQVAGAVETDKNGFPWDARIHSSNHAKVADGTWRKRRGIDDATVAQVEGELRAVMGAPAAQPQVQAPPAPQAVPLPPADPLAIPDALKRPQVPAPEAPAAPPVQAPAADPMAGFVQLVSRTSAAIGNGKIKQDQVMAICQQHGVPSLPMLSNRLDLLPIIAEAIDALIQLAG